VVRILGEFGFEVIARRGSHAKLRRIGADGSPQTLTVPLHAELDTGTCRSILRQASRYVPYDQLHPHFYSD
jgi:predicted RNA binding protein YcfA (HicA-like mRNA interferase family)